VNFGRHQFTIQSSKVITTLFDTLFSVSQSLLISLTTTIITNLQTAKMQFFSLVLAFAATASALVPSSLDRRCGAAGGEYPSHTELKSYQSC